MLRMLNNNEETDKDVWTGSEHTGVQHACLDLTFRFNV